MSPKAGSIEARQFDPRREQQARLGDAAGGLGGRLADTLNARMAAWLGPGLALTLKGVEVAYGPSAGAAGRVALGLRGGAVTPRLIADGALFFRYYESLLSGPATPTAESKPCELGPTERALGAELGARWIGCLPGFGAPPKVADVWVLPLEDAPALPGAAWPLLRLTLALEGNGEPALEILAPLSLLEGGAPVPAAGARSQEPTRRLGQTPVRMQAMLGTVRLRLKELYELRPGDCVLLENGPADGAVVALGREPVFKARPGRTGRYLAVQILGPLTPKNGG